MAIMLQQISLLFFAVYVIYKKNYSIYFSQHM